MPRRVSLPDFAVEMETDVEQRLWRICYGSTKASLHVSRLLMFHLYHPTHSWEINDLSLYTGRGIELIDHDTQ